MLAPRLAFIGADLLVETLRRVCNRKSGSPHGPQDHAQATLAPILKKQDGLIDFLPLSNQRLSIASADSSRGQGAYHGFFRGHNSASTQGKLPLRRRWRPGQLHVEEKPIASSASAHNSALETFRGSTRRQKNACPARDFVNGYRPNKCRKARDACDVKARNSKVGNGDFSCARGKRSIFCSASEQEASFCQSELLHSVAYERFSKADHGY